VAANPKAPFATAKDLLAAAKAQPGKYTISSASLRLFVELLNSRAGIKLLHIPYKGGALATSDAIAGQVNMVYAALPVLLPFIHSGKLRALAVTSRHRSTALPDVPSFAELGIDYDISIHYTIYAPSGVPAAVRQKLIQATQAISQEKDFRARLLASGTEADSNHPEQLEAEARRDLAMWQQVAKERPDLVELGK
jgi:tripartite-type tricarboxylate transporter receptor subunit TctC